MTRDDALKALTLEPAASTEEVERRYRELYSDFQLRLTNAPTAPLKRVYQQRLQELDEARASLAGASGALDPDLPIQTPVNGSDFATAESPADPDGVGGPLTAIERKKSLFSRPWRIAAAVVAALFVLRAVGGARSRPPIVVPSTPTPIGAPAARAPRAPRAPAVHKPALPSAEETRATPARSRTSTARDVPLSNNRVMLVVVGDQSGAAADLLRAALAKDHLEVVTGDDDLGGASSEAGVARTERLRSSARHRGARLLALCAVTITPSAAANEFGMASASASVDVRVVDAMTGEIVASRQSHQTGAGTSPAGATDNAVRRATDVVAAAVSPEVIAHRP